MTALPPFHASVSDEMRAVIGDRLDAIEREEGVRILFAIESGSRAWGFPSPDSDYDVRFVYAHPPDWYLSLEPGRDVIERPISDELDIGGWDLRKALNLLLKPNPVMLEWLSSPIRYRRHEDVCARLEDLAGRTAHAAACVHHYRNLGEGQWTRHVGDAAEVNCKKYFYSLRPALALRWVRLNPDVPPPMNIQAMSERLDLDPGTLDEIARLLEIKAATRETGPGPRLPGIDRLIADELETARTAPPRRERRDLRPEAETLFCDIVKGGVA